MTPPRVAVRGMAVSGRFRGASGTPPPTVCPGMGGGGRSPLIRPCGATFPQGGRQGLQFLPGCWREVSRGVGDAAPYGLPGNGRQREVAPHPALRGHLPPRGKARAAGEGFIPPGEGRQREVAAGWGHPALRMGDMETLWGLHEQSFPGRRAVGAGHARPGGWREHPSMVRPVGRGLDPSAGGCPGDGRWRKPSRGVGDAAPYGLPGMGGDGSLPLIRPCGATFPRGGRQGLLLAAAEACPYPGSWSSVRSWRVRL